MDSAVLSQFRSIIGADQVLDSAEDLSVYAYDGTATLRVAPACVLLPETVQQVAAIMTVAHSQRLPVITRGSGTGLAGGAVPVEAASSSAWCAWIASLKWTRLTSPWWWSPE